MKTIEKYPILTDLMTNYRNRLLLLQIQNDQEGLDIEFLMDNVIGDAHTIYDKLLVNVTIQERARLHRELERCLYDDGLLMLGEDHWMTDTYDYPPDTAEYENYWEELDKDPLDPFYGEIEKCLSVKELGL